MKILSIGEILWDVFDGEERLGGATFNFSAQSAHLGAEIAMISAAGDDARGRLALARARELGVDTRWLRTTGEHPTGHVSVTLTDGQPDYIIHRPAAYDDIEMGAETVAAVQRFEPDWLYFGTLHFIDPRPKLALQKLITALPNTRRFYDINLRKDCYNAELLGELLALADVLKISEAETAEVSGMLGVEFPEEAARRYGLEMICTTLGAEGSRVWAGGQTVEAPGYAVRVADAVGAGDAFSAAFLHGLGQGWAMEKTADFANRVGAVIASKHGATPEWRVEEAWGLGGD